MNVPPPAAVPLPDQPLLALTGATGFLGRHLVVALAARGFRLRVLARRDPAHPLWQECVPEIVPGDLADAGALARLVEGADVVIHLGGLIKARSRAEFLAVNRDGAARLAQAVQARAAGAHLIGISSLAARAPQISAYAASKRAGEEALAAHFGGRLSILRPPAIYGPWDRASLGIFQTARSPLIPLPGHAASRIAMIHVADAVAAVAALAAWSEAPGGGIHALADTNPAGYAPREILGTAAEVQGRQVHFLPLPVPLVLLAGGVASVLAWASRRPAVFTAGKAREMVYPDWSVPPAELLPASLATPRIGLRQGFAETVAWYRQAGWLA